MKYRLVTLLPIPFVALLGVTWFLGAASAHARSIPIGPPDAVMTTTPTAMQCSGAPVRPGWVIVSHFTDWAQYGNNPLTMGTMETISAVDAITDTTTV